MSCERSQGKGTTWVTNTPAPSAPNSCASALLPTNEMLTNSVFSRIRRAQRMRDEMGS